MVLKHIPAMLSLLCELLSSTWYIFQRAIFGDEIGRDDVLSSLGYILEKNKKKTCFLSKVLNCFVSIHWSFIVWDIENKVAVMPIYQVTYTLHIGLYMFSKSTKQLY